MVCFCPVPAGIAPASCPAGAALLTFARLSLRMSGIVRTETSRNVSSPEAVTFSHRRSAMTRMILKYVVGAAIVS